MGTLSLVNYGWNCDWENVWLSVCKRANHPGESVCVGRVILHARDNYLVMTEVGPVDAAVTGRFRFNAGRPIDYPVIGDWVMLAEEDVCTRMNKIVEVLPRETIVVRKAAGSRVEKQGIAANLQTLMICMAVNQDFQIRRLERYVILARESGVQPIVVLTKVDLVEDIHSYLAQVKSVAPNLQVVAISSFTGEGVGSLLQYLPIGTSAVLVGSSGVGKSSLINCLLGTEQQSVYEVRDGDGRGRHTTTQRELFLLPNGSTLIDTPGMRELQLWADAGDVDTSFEDILELSQSCHFRDCTHHSEPLCAVQVALQSGQLSQERYLNYIKLQREIAFLERKTDTRLAQEERNIWKQRTKDSRTAHKKHRN